MIARRRLGLVSVVAALIVTAAVSCGAGPFGTATPTVEVPPRTCVAAFGGGEVILMRLLDGDSDRARLELAEPIAVALAAGRHCVAVDGERLYTISRDGTVTEHQPFTDEAPRSIDLPFSLDSQGTSTPRGRFGSLWVRGRHVYVGSEDRVTYINFNRSSLSTVEVWRGEHRKPVDYFVEAGDKLVAIDNVTWPRYAITLDISRIDRPSVLHEKLLPNPGPGSFTGGVNLDESTIALIARSGGVYGRANLLFRSSVSDRFLFSKEVVAESYMWEPTEEDENRFHPVPRDPDEIVGGKYSPFSDIDRVGERVFIAAEERGILSAPRTELDAVKQHKVARTCLAIAALDGDILISLEMVSNDTASDIVIYRWDAARNELVEQAREQLDKRLQRLVN